MKEANFDRSENRGDAVQASKNKTLIGQVYGGGGGGSHQKCTLISASVVWQRGVKNAGSRLYTDTLLAGSRSVGRPTQTVA